MRDYNNTEVKICPICGKGYTDYPALSRRDNMTYICPQCGGNEALEDFYKVFDENDKRGDKAS